MKIRNGFVSNSSSSSFVVAGFEVNPETEFDDDWYENYSVLNSSDYDIEDGKVVLGVEIFSIDDCGLIDCDSLDLEELSDKLKELKEKCEKANIEVLSKGKLYGGVKVC